MGTKYNNSGLFSRGHTPWCKGGQLSEETCRKISLAKLGSKHTLESKLKMSIAKLGKPSNRLGKKHTQKIKDKLSDFWLGRPKPWLKGRKLAENHRQKLSLAKLGTKRLPFSEATKKKMRENRLKQVIPFKDTSIEIKLQNFLKEQKIEFVTHYPILGQPDIFIKPNICIFADGCYWHKCPDCGFGHGKERDIMVTRELQKQGYIVIRMWEHEIKSNDFNIKNFIS